MYKYEKKYVFSLNGGIKCEVTVRYIRIKRILLLTF